MKEWIDSYQTMKTIINHKNLLRKALIEKVVLKLQKAKLSKEIKSFYHIKNFVVCRAGLKSWTARFFHDYIEVFGNASMLKKITTAAYNHKRTIIYLENTTNLADGKKLKIPSMKYWKDPTSYESIKKAMNYLEVHDNHIMKVMIEKEGSWLLQGRSGTGKSSLMKIFMTKLRCDYVVNYTRSYDIKKTLIDIEQFRLTHHESCIILMYEEIDRNLVTPEVDTSDKAIKEDAKAIYSQYFDKQPNESINSWKYSKDSSGTSGRRSMEQWVEPVIIDLSLRLAACLKDTALLKKSVVIKDNSDLNINKLLDAVEDIHQFSLSLLSNVKIFMSTNSVFNIENLSPSIREKIETCFRPGRVNVIQFPYLSKHKLKACLEDFYQQHIDESLIDSLMKNQFFKQFNLHIFLELYPSYNSKLVNEMISTCEEFKHVTVIDQFVKGDNLIDKNLSSAPVDDDDD